MKRNKIIYWVATGLLSLLILFSASMYFINTTEIKELFVGFGYNERIVIPLAVLKLLGIAAILSNISKTLKEWAYFGFLMDFILAIEAHLAVEDNQHMAATIATVLWLVSYIYNKKIYT